MAATCSIQNIEAANSWTYDEPKIGKGSFGQQPVSLVGWPSSCVAMTEAERKEWKDESRDKAENPRGCVRTKLSILGSGFPQQTEESFRNEPLDSGLNAPMRIWRNPVSVHVYLWRIVGSW